MFIFFIVTPSYPSLFCIPDPVPSPCVVYPAPSSVMSGAPMMMHVPEFVIFFASVVLVVILSHVVPAIVGAGGCIVMFLFSDVCLFPALSVAFTYHSYFPLMSCIVFEYVLVVCTGMSTC